MKSVLFLVSGGGGNLKFIHQAMNSGIIKDVCLGVIADRECGALEYAKGNGIFNKKIVYSRDKSKELLQAIERISPDVIVTNFHKILGEDIVNANRNNMINIHYSLLPAFSGFIGVKPIEEAYNRGCKYIGPTCHRVNEEVDAGYILSQYAFPTPKLFDEAVTKMFRSGCLVLLSGIEQVVGDSIQRDGKYYPYIDQRIDKFSKFFWDNLARL